MKNLKSFLIVSLIVACASIMHAQAEPEIWRNPKVYGINKEKAHAEFTVFSNKSEALKSLDLNNPWNSESYLSLNGQWDFNWYNSVDAVPEDWYQVATGVKEWHQIPVPGTWQAAGFDRYYYLNVNMPYEFNWSTGERAKGFREGEIEQSKESGYIPDNMQRVGCYRKQVKLTKAQLNERVVLRMGGLEAGVEVYVNGKEVGYSQGSMTPAEFNISSFLSEGENLIALKVYRWTDGSYMEVQDMIRFAGIYRDVFLKFEPQQHIQDIKFIGTPDKSLKTINADYHVVIANSAPKKIKKAELTFELFENGSAGVVKSWSKPIAELGAKAELTVKGKMELQNMKLWSPDLPNLYTLLTTLKDAKGNILQLTRIDAGFKRFEDINGNLHLNGKRFHIRGVNRHDHHPVYGKHVPLKNMIRDLQIMKENNINTVRTSHYPNDERWYYLCNRYGMALLDEANVESHAFEDVPGNRPQWLNASVDRVESMIERDKNHPSVFIWSLGNEQGWGWSKAFDAQFNRARELDSSRLVMCDRGGRFSNKWKSDNKLRLDKPNTITPMYGAVSKMEKYLNNRDTDQRPFFMCEYRHAMGNSVGALKEVWDMVYANEDNGLNGGCIWDWIDQGVEAFDKDGTKYYQYGGDWGDKTSQWNFCLNGLILSDQGWTPKLVEVKKCYEPFTVEAVSADKGMFEVRNRLNQLSMSGVKIAWQLSENGKIVQKGVVEGVNTKAGETQAFKVPFDKSKLQQEKEYFLHIRFIQKDKTALLAAGHEISFSEFKIQGDFAYQAKENKGKVQVKDTDTSIYVTTANGVSLEFSKALGQLISMKVKGKELLAEGKENPWFDHSMAWIDNLYNRRTRVPKINTYPKYDLDNITKIDRPVISVEKGNEKAIIKIQQSYMSKKNAGFKEEQSWIINGNGQIEVKEAVSPLGDLNNKTWIARVGLRIPLNSTLNNVCYYGMGPYENYSDRSYGSWMGIHKSKVDDFYVPYPKPQDQGNREQVRWMKLTDRAGNGLKIIAPNPMSIGVLPYSVNELKAASHTIDLPKETTTTEVRIAAKLTGIGNGSCGPVTYPEYRVTAEAVEYNFILIPFVK